MTHQKHLCALAILATVLMQTGAFLSDARAQDAAPAEASTPAATPTGESGEADPSPRATGAGVPAIEEGAAPHEGAAADGRDAVADGGPCPVCEPIVQRHLEQPSDAQILARAQRIRERERAERRAEQAPRRARRRLARRIILPILGAIGIGGIVAASVAISNRPPREPLFEPGDLCILYCD